jgi:hypothetical protein
MCLKCLVEVKKIIPININFIYFLIEILKEKQNIESKNLYL